MLTYKTGDLIQALKNKEVDVIAHQANCFCTMGSGVAKSIRTAFPEAYSVDCATVKGDMNKLGTISHATTQYGDVFNLYGQYNYGRDGKVYTDLGALSSAFIMMEATLRMNGFEGTIGMPKIGSGLGGMPWDTIEPIIKRVFDDYEVIIYVLEGT